MYIKLAWRNLWRNHRRTLITASSIMFAVIFALFIESLERGAHDLMIENMTSFHTGYIQVQDERFDSEPSLDNSFHIDEELAGRILRVDSEVDFLIPRIEAFMLATGDELTRGALMIGIDLEAESRYNELDHRLTEGRFFRPGDGTAVLAEGLANRLQLAVGDSLVLLGQGRFGMTAAGIFKVSGLVRHPLREMNNQMVYLSLPDAQWLLSSEEHITSLLVTPRNPRNTDNIAASLRQELAGEEFRVFTWQEMMPDLLEALDFDRAQTRVIMGILYVVIGFGIFGTILTMTLERLREFGILLSMGMQRVKLATVLFIETLFISFLGIAAGSLAGFLILFYFNRNPIDMGSDMEELFQDLGFEPILPTALAPDIFLWQTLLIFLITMLICFYPTLKIFRLNIQEAARK